MLEVFFVSFLCLSKNKVICKITIELVIILIIIEFWSNVDFKSYLRLLELFGSAYTPYLSGGVVRLFFILIFF
jgi:hypothetical protein